MNTAAVHPFAPEEVMAFFDGELPAAEAKALAAHLDGCSECASLAGQFRGLSQSLSQWNVPPVPLKLEEAVNDFAAQADSKSKAYKPAKLIRAGIWNWRLWAIGGAGAVAGVLLLLGIGLSAVFYEDRAASHPMASVMMAQRTEANSESYAVAGSLKSQMHNSQESARPGAVAGIASDGGLASVANPPALPTPMIARTASLTITVKDIATARSLLDAMLAKHQGYSAQLTVESTANAPRVLQASLRIPVQRLSAAIADFKTLGRVERESQSGEDVSQQHIDLAERLKTARDTEERFRGILRQRTGTVADVLEVEEGIARVRGEIESMEAEQTALEHRVDFATIDLQLAEEYKAEILSPTASFGPRMRHAFVEGFRNASETVVGIVLFLIEYGLSILIWVAIIPLPISFFWLRYRKARAKM
jgi:hypothetical protein